MYLLKPYLALVGAALMVASFFMITQPGDAVAFYLSALASSNEEAGSWHKSFVVESTRSAMWQTPMYPLCVHLTQVAGCVTLCLGAILAVSISFGSSKRFTEGLCLLWALVAYLLTIHSTKSRRAADVIAELQRLSALKAAIYACTLLLVAALAVNQLMRKTPKGPKAKQT